MKSKIKIGESYLTNEGYELIVINYINSKQILVKFSEFDIEEFYVHSSALLRGRIKNPLHKSVFGVGYFGIGIHKSRINKIINPFYRVWQGMLDRCYSGNYPQYKNVTVDDYWHNFQNFAEWCKDNYVDGWELDKDISGKNIYSANTAMFVPKEINMAYVQNNNRLKDNFLGAKVVTECGKFTAYIKKFGKFVFLGNFENQKEARIAYIHARIIYLKELIEKWEKSLNKKVIDSINKDIIELNEIIRSHES